MAQVSGMAEFASNLKAELLSVRYGLATRQLTKGEAESRLAVIRRRREQGAAELRMPQKEERPS